MRLTSLKQDEVVDGYTMYSNILVMGDTAYFWLSSLTFGTGLWKTDGTAAGTTLIKNLAPGDQFTRLAASQLVNVGGKIFFANDDGSSGWELWVSDGTASGTQLVRDIAPGPADSSPMDIVAFNGRAYFTAQGADGQRHLWSSDGTSTGTNQLGEALVTGPLIPYGGSLYFIANGSPWPQLWVTDGTASGTHEVIELTGSGTPPDVGAQWAVGDALYLGTATGLWRTDGTAAHTTQLTTSAAGQIVPVNGTIFFQSYGGSGCCDLWTTDGSAAHTQAIPGVHALQLIGVNGLLYFQSTDPMNGLGIVWSSDGTPSGTGPVSPWIGQGQDAFTAAGNVLYDRVAEDGYYDQIWSLDTDAQTSQLLFGTDYQNALYSIDSLTPFGHSLLFFAGTSDIGWQLYSSDGTKAGTMAISHLPTMAIEPVLGPAMLNGTLFFNADEGPSSDNELWKSDGTTAGTSLVKTLPSVGEQPLAFIQRFRSWTTLGNRLLFAEDSQTDFPGQLWASDGTATGTAEIGPFTAVEHPRNLLTVGGLAYFVGDSGLWKTDGTSAGTTLIAPGAKFPAKVGSNLLYVQNDSLWSLNGSGSPVMLASAPDFLGAAGSQSLYFATSACPSAGACASLWKSDGTSAGTIFVGTLPSLPSAMKVSGDRLFFVEDDGTTGNEPWTSDGTSSGTMELKDIALGAAGSNPFSLTPLSGRLFFFANDGVSGNELWTSDGSPEGTQLVKDIAPGASGSSAPLADPSPVFGGLPSMIGLDPEGMLVFAASDGASGTELWESDGTTAGTVLVQDINPGPASSNPEGLTRDANAVYFTADDGATGPQLYSLKIDDLPNLPVIACPADVKAEATSPSGAVINYSPATVSHTNASVTLAYSKPSGSAFPLGATPVQASVRSNVGTGTACTFLVTVADTTPPMLTCPADVDAAGSSSGAAISYPAPTATDAVTPSPTVTEDPPSGSQFPAGKTTVRVTATDAAGNVAHCSFTVNVEVPPASPRKKSGGCSHTATGELAWLVALGWVLARRRRILG